MSRPTNSAGSASATAPGSLATNTEAKVATTNQTITIPPDAGVIYWELKMQRVLNPCEYNMRYWFQKLGTVEAHDSYYIGVLQHNHYELCKYIQGNAEPWLLLAPKEKIVKSDQHFRGKMTSRRVLLDMVDHRREEANNYRDTIAEKLIEYGYTPEKPDPPPAQVPKLQSL